MAQLQPMEAYLHREGFARFLAERYTINKESMKSYMLVTNNAIEEKVSCYCCHFTMHASTVLKRGVRSSIFAEVLKQSFVEQN
jgi:hypothetical protein